MAENYISASHTPGLVDHVRSEFQALVCNHPGGHKRMAGAMREDSTFPSEESAEYTADMCLRIATALDRWIEERPVNVGVAHKLRTTRSPTGRTFTPTSTTMA